MSIRPLGTGYSNANLNAAVTIFKTDGSGEIAGDPMHKRVRIAADGAGVWVALSKGTLVVATAGTADEILIPAGTSELFEMGSDFDNLSIINAAGSCKVSATPVDM